MATILDLYIWTITFFGHSGTPSIDICVGTCTRRERLSCE